MMKTYKVKIVETLVKEIEVDAENSKEAYDIAKALYKAGDVVLSADDYDETNIYVEE